MNIDIHRRSVMIKLPSSEAMHRQLVTVEEGLTLLKSRGWLVMPRDELAGKLMSLTVAGEPRYGNSQPGRISSLGIKRFAGKGELSNCCVLEAICLRHEHQKADREKPQLTLRVPKTLNINLRLNPC
ncbi:hypothetical protein [Escherichia coli]|uniref:hypothetical protein n=1 Tax=Escherichia coli TaxID=562 RepID=UPI001CDD7BEF|nr:hypothetical protein [Escherichia coli]